MLAEKHAFAAGLLLVAAIDAMSRYEAGPRRTARRQVGKEFKAFVQQELPSFANSEAADILYEKCRNGLAHEARLKDGTEFTLDDSVTLTQVGQIARINPSALLREVRGALSRFVAVISADNVAREQFARLLEADFLFELTGSKTGAAAS